MNEKQMVAQENGSEQNVERLKSVIRMTPAVDIYETADETIIEELEKSLNIHPIFCKLLAQRGIETYEAAKLFFRPSLTHLHDPFLMLGMEKAVLRLEKAIENANPATPRCSGYGSNGVVVDKVAHRGFLKSGCRFKYSGLACANCT